MKPVNQAAKYKKVEVKAKTFVSCSSSVASVMGRDVLSFSMISYPKGAIALICVNEYFERFSFFGVRNSLSIFLTNNIGYDEDTATIIIHLFLMVCFATPLIGAAIADSFLGAYRTIFYFSLVNVFGGILLSFSATPFLPFPIFSLAATGLVFIAIGSGGRKPCLSALGADQFKLPVQATQQIQFFSLCNWMVAAAGLSATILSPTIRSRVSCFEEKTCFSLMFAVAVLFMILSIVFLVVGQNLYILEKPQGNIITAVSEKVKNYNKNTYPKTHWLDTSIGKHGLDLVNDVKVVLGLLPLYISMFCYAALYWQQSSRWTFQASRMNRNIFGYIVEPDQFQVTLQILLLVLIPVCEKWIYPLLSRCNVLTGQLSKIFWGGNFAALAFLFSGILEVNIMNSTSENAEVHVAWQLPQFLAIVIAEILFEITSKEFSYSEAPNSMKSLMQSVFLLTNAVGNLLVVLIAKFKFVMKQEYEFFFFAGLMFVNMLLFAVIGARYKRNKRKIKEAENATIAMEMNHIPEQNHTTTRL